MEMMGELLGEKICSIFAKEVQDLREVFMK